MDQVDQKQYEELEENDRVNYNGTKHNVNESTVFTTVMEKDYLNCAEVTKNSFSELFDKRLKELSKLTGKKITKRRIAEMFGISYEAFRKIVNRSQSTVSRDRIIAICALLRFDTNDASEALRHYEMEELNDYNRRDEIIMEQLDAFSWHDDESQSGDQNSEQTEDIIKRCKMDEFIEQNEENNTIIRINKKLVKEAYHGLEISSYKTAEKQKTIHYPFKLIRKKVENELPFYLRYKYNEQRSHKIFPEAVLNNTVRASMEFDNDGEKIAIWVKANTCIDSENEKYQFCFYSCSVCKQTVEKYNSIDDAGIFKESYYELKKLAESELDRINKIYLDTKTFGFLVSYKVINDKFHFVAEVYNNLYPTLDEYYLMDYSDGQYVMTVSSRSRFAEMLLGKVQCDMFSSKTHVRDGIYAVYRNIDEAYYEWMKFKTQPVSVYDNKRIIARVRYDYYKFLMREIQEFGTTLFSMTYYNHFSQNYISDEELMKHVDYYELDEKYCAVYKENNRYGDCVPGFFPYCFKNLIYKEIEYGYEFESNAHKEIISCNNTADFTLPDGSSVTLSLKDLFDAHVLGITNIKDILSFLMKNHSLKIWRFLAPFDFEFINIIKEKLLSDIKSDYLYDDSFIDYDELRKHIYAEDIIKKALELNNDIEDFAVKYMKDEERVKFNLDELSKSLWTDVHDYFYSYYSDKFHSKEWIKHNIEHYDEGITDEYYWSFCFRCHFHEIFNQLSDIS